MKKLATITLFAILIVSCTQTVTPTAIETITVPPIPTVTFTPEPTSTPVVSNLDGVLFFDMNASGLLDKASFVLMLDKKGKPPLIIQKLFPEISGKNGEIFSVDEPSLTGFNVCAVISKIEYCATTDSAGKFFITNIPIESGAKVALKISDLNAENEQLAMTYLNLWVQTVIIPEYEINGVSIPEQELIETKTMPLGQAYVTTGESLVVGLTQGQLTLPLRQDDFKSIENFNDLDPRQDYALAWNGVSTITNNFPNYNSNAFGDNHSGLDFLSKQNNEFIISSASGELSDSFTGQINMSLGNYKIRYGHNKVNLISTNERQIYRGQILAIIGRQGTNHTHIHWAVWGGGKQDSEGFPGIFDPFFPETPINQGCKEYEGIRYEHLICAQKNSPSWTVYNTPAFGLK